MASLKAAFRGIGVKRGENQGMPRTPGIPSPSRARGIAPFLRRSCTCCDPRGSVLTSGRSTDFTPSSAVSQGHSSLAGGGVRWRAYAGR